MLKNKETTRIPKDSISVESNFETNRVWQFIDCSIVDFPPYYRKIKDSSKENRISDFLIYHFHCCMSEQLNGFPPYYFAKNPTQSQSDRETDIGVFVIIPNEKPITLIEFEAKRLSKTSNNKEYVCGERGGIERFKRNDHAPHLSECGMFAYVQNGISANWVNKINGWINELAETNAYPTINWLKEETLTKVDSFPKVEKYTSSHPCLPPRNSIILWHYFIEL
ncbi:MAG: hypothetical protein LBR10_12040 [Prevotellaceae bacterium]|nr:hypothetical protein [Prevotellaceae bacterium]